MNPAALMLALLAADPRPFNDRGVFVFGHVVLDFRHDAEVTASRQPLRNCSTASLYCADGELFNIVLPRACEEIRVGSRWRVGEMETVVIGRRSSAQGVEATAVAEDEQIWYLQSNERPEVIYEYSRAGGVGMLYHDLRGELDFARMARNDDLDQFRRAIMGVAGREHLALALRTLDPFAPCRGETLRRGG